MLVHLRNPARDLEVAGPIRIERLLDDLEINRESVIVIRDGELVPRDAVLPDDADVEIRPVISGGAR